MRDELIVFVKAPRPGSVKTRLAATIGAEAAAAVYRRLAETEIRATAPLRDEYRQTFCFAPTDAEAELRAWLGNVPLVAQQGADLGARMARAFEVAFAGGARRTVLIGSDVPEVRRSHVRDALDGLDRHDVVLGPTHDGGYYLVALSRPQPGLFTDMAWSTPDVLVATLDRTARLGLGVRTLEPLTDVDTLEDLRLVWPRVRPLLPIALAAELAGRFPLDTGIGGT